MSNTLTRQLQNRKDEAVRFTRGALRDGDRADEIEAEDLEDYAERKGIQLSTPGRGERMARKTVTDYRAELKELKEQVRGGLEKENESLQDQLDQVADIVGGEEEEDGEGEGDEEDEDEGDSRTTD
jgi:hypothetical protein